MSGEPEREDIDAVVGPAGDVVGRKPRANRPPRASPRNVAAGAGLQCDHEAIGN